VTQPEEHADPQDADPQDDDAAADDVPEHQQLILEDSERREADRDAAPGTHLEHRTSDEVTPPP
jgi:hypothetical protein